MRDKMLAIEFSRVCALNERSSENEMDWIIKTNSILSLSLSLIKRDGRNTTAT